MSLKAFHIFFVAIVTLFAVGLGSWAVRDYRATGAASSLVLAIGAFAASLLMFGYGRWFLRKLKGVSYL